MAGLETGELDLAYGMTGKLLQRVMADPKLRWDPNYTSPWHLVFPGYNEPSSPFHDPRVRQAVSLAINRQFLVKQETQGIGKPWGNWISHENRDALRGDGTELPVPPYDPAKARQLLAEAGYPNGFDFDWYVPFAPYYDMAERILNDLRAAVEGADAVCSHRARASRAASSISRARIWSPRASRRCAASGGAGSRRSCRIRWRRSTRSSPSTTRWRSRPTITSRCAAPRCGSELGSS